MPPAGSLGPALPQCAATYSRRRRVRGRGCGGRADRTGDTAADRLPSAGRKGCTQAAAASAAAAPGRRHGATRPCSGVALQKPGEMRGKRRHRPHQASGRCALAAGAQSEAEPVGGWLRCLPRAKKLLRGGVASPAAGGAPSGLARRRSRVRTVRAAPAVRSVAPRWHRCPHCCLVGYTVCTSLETLGAGHRRLSRTGLEHWSTLVL